VERPADQPIQVKLEAALPLCGSLVSIVQTVVSFITTSPPAKPLAAYSRI
jgi:hypothetical protein